MILFDFHCLNEHCNHTFEYLLAGGEISPRCPECGDQTEQLMSYNPTKEYNPRRDALIQKDTNIRNKLLGKVPWRRSSESRSD